MFCVSSSYPCHPCGYKQALRDMLVMLDMVEDVNGYGGEYFEATDRIRYEIMERLEDLNTTSKKDGNT